MEEVNAVVGRLPAGNPAGQTSGYGGGYMSLRYIGAQPRAFKRTAAAAR